MDVDRETLPTKLRASAVAAEMMIQTDVNFQDLYEATGMEITDQVVDEICGSNTKVINLKLNSCNKLTDFSLVSIGRYCKNLRSISLEGCVNVGHVGLRSLAMHCRLLHSIDFVGYCIDDAGLRIIAASLDKLISLNLTGCTSITDRGLSQVAHCCTKLKILKLGGCYKIGESGVWAFYELENCKELEEIELFGCIYLSDHALVAISKRCPSLKKIDISESPDISGRSICKLISYANKLTDFVASRCPRAIDDETASHVIENSHTRIVQLDLSYCNLSDDLTIRISSCSKLKFLSISGCQINDKVILEYSKCLSNLESLEVFESDITNHSIELLFPGEGGAGLSYLGLTACSKVDESFLRQAEPKFKFSTLAITKAFVGFIPRRSEQELRESAQIYYDRTIASILIQRCVRGMIVRIGIYRRKREENIVNCGLLQLQALYRGIQSRIATKKFRLYEKKAAAATLIASSFKRYKQMRYYKEYLFDKMIKERDNNASKVIQTYYRSFNARIILINLKVRKIEKQEKLQEEMEKRKKATVTIQKTARSMLARNILKHLTKQKLKEQEHAQRKLVSTLMIQRIFRGYRGRVKANDLQLKVHRLEQEWFCARQIQCAWRGMLGRRDFKQETRLHEFKYNEDKARVIQKVWRGCLDRKRVNFIRGLHALNKKEVEAAQTIQRIFRGNIGRHKAFLENKSIRHKIEELKASKVIQRIYRGYKGRETAEFTKGLKSIGSKTSPLIEAINAKEECYNEEIHRKHVLRKIICNLEEEISNLQKDLVLTREMKSKFVDSSIITGAPQRCAKEVVMAALEKNISFKKRELDETRLVHAEVVQREKGHSKEIYQLKKQLSTLRSSIRSKIKTERHERYYKGLKARENV